MKKKIFSLLVMLLTLATGTTRAYEAQIGEGSSLIAYFPFYTLYNYSMSENLFLASELTAAGMQAGPITSFSWYATSSPGYAQNGLSIWVANVTDEALTTTSHVSTNMTLVYTGGMTPALGWNEFVFNEGTFEWDGTSNLLILFQRNNGSWNSSISWQATDAGFTGMSYKYQDSQSIDTTVPNGMTTAVLRPNIIIKGEGGGIKSFELTKAKDAEAHGSIVFKVDGNVVTNAVEGQTVTVEVTPNDYYVVNKFGGQWYAGMVAAPRRAEGQQIDLLGMIDLKPVEGKDNTWEFTMMRANAEVDFTYKKEAESPDITSVELSGEQLAYDGTSQTPTIIVKDGNKELKEGTDYVISYEGVAPTVYGPSTKAPTKAGTYKAIVTFTVPSDYIGTKEVEFTIERGEPVFTPPTPIRDLVFNGTEQELIIPGTAPIGGSLFYALGISPVTSAFNGTIPAMTDAGMYFVNYKLFGDDNVNSSDVEGFYVSIAPKAAEDVKLSIVVNEDKTVTLKDGDLVLRPGEDYTIALKDKDGNPIDVATALANDGTYQATLMLKGNYSGELSAEIVIDNGSVTGISDAPRLNNKANDKWYTIDGRKVAQPTKGLYIVNGRKVVIK